MGHASARLYCAVIAIYRSSMLASNYWFNHRFPALNKGGGGTAEVGRSFLVEM
jgi:hypothetical protein